MYNSIRDQNSLIYFLNLNIQYKIINKIFLTHMYICMRINFFFETSKCIYNVINILQTKQKPFCLKNKLKNVVL